jgi:hypothetical protein
MNNLNIFFTLAVIDFESSRRSGSGDYHTMRVTHYEIFGESDDEEVHHSRELVYTQSKLFALWHRIYKISPNWFFWDWLLSKTMGDEITVGPLTVFGYNGCRFLHRLETPFGVLKFYPPSSYPIGCRYTWGGVEFKYWGGKHE